MDQDILPMKAAAFIEDNRLPGNLFHPYEWGGYIIWRLHPSYGSFIDGRAIGPMDEHREVLSAGPRWREVLDSRGVNTVLYWPLLPYEGRVPPVVLALMGDEGWRPAYWDLQSLVFVRAGTPGPSVSRPAMWDLLQSLITANIAASPAEAKNYSALGELYLARGLRREAGAAFEQALALDPADGTAAFWLRALGRRIGG
jgi:tetratricopeptide (TPR) repeat protein